jgi:ech hydrogenase subunit E
VRIRTPTFANLPSLVHMVPGNELGQVPALVLSIDPCISCTER